MGKPQEVDQSELFVRALGGLVTATQATQLRLFHGLVPALAGLREVEGRVATLAGSGAFRKGAAIQSGVELRALASLVASAAQVIETQAAELGYPLTNALADYRASGADLGTLAAIRAAMPDIADLDWDAWSASLVDPNSDNRP